MPLKSLPVAGAAIASLVILAMPAAAGSPSFECRTSGHNAAERTICRSRYLSMLDRRMSAKYYEVRAMLSPRAGWRLRRIQRYWLAERNACGMWRRCIASAYGRRIRQLRQFENCFDHTAHPRCIPRLMRRHAISLR